MSKSPDPFSFLRASWSGMSQGLQVPQHALPTSDPDEIERRITDLRTVEQWLSLNLNMVKTSIQALEIQKGTLVAIQSFRQAMGDFGKDAMGAANFHPTGSGVQVSPTEEAPEIKAESNPQAAQAALDQVASQAGWWWSSMQDQFSQLVNTAQAMQQTAETAKTAGGAAQAAPAPKKSRPAARSQGRSAAKKPAATRATPKKHAAK